MSDTIKDLLDEHDEFMKTHALIHVSCCYAVEVPKDYDPKNPEHQEALLKKFMEENQVEVVETSNGKRSQYFKMKDGRVSHFDEISIVGEPYV